MDFGFKNSVGDLLSPCKPDRADSLQRALRSWDRIRCHGSEGSALGPKVIIYHMVKRFRERGFSMRFAYGSRCVFFGHLQAGRNSTEFWTLPLLKSALQTHEGPTETPKGHSVHGRKALEKWKPISETEGTNHYSLSANNQPINEWVNRSIGRSTNQSNIGGSIDQSTNRLMKLPTNLNWRENNRI